MVDQIFSWCVTATSEFSHWASSNNESILWRAYWRKGFNARLAHYFLDHAVCWSLFEELRERNWNGLIFLPFETLHQKILMEGTFADGIFAQIIDHPSVTILDKFILADVFISNEKNDHYNIGVGFRSLGGSRPIGSDPSTHDNLVLVSDRLYLKTYLSIFWWCRL